MPIIETQPRRAFEKFESHMSDIVNGVLHLPSGVTVTLKWKEEAGTLALTRGGVPVPVPVNTKLGTLYLSLAQDVMAVREGPRYRLRTKRYAYKLLGSDDPRADALIRWEFDAEVDDVTHCRNHIHVNASFPAGHGTLYLNRLHLPTAWVLVEHVLRFLFHDLEVAPKTHDWPAKLRASETVFYERFTSKRYRFRG